MGNQVATKKSAELSTDVLDDIFDTAGEGASFDSSEMQIPFVRILQALSPQLNKKKPEFIEGASSSDMYNTVTGQHWDGEEGLVVVPCYQTTKYLEFVPRDQGGGFKGEIPANDPKRSYRMAMSWLSLTSTTAWWWAKTVAINLRSST